MHASLWKGSCQEGLDVTTSTPICHKRRAIESSSQGGKRKGNFQGVFQGHPCKTVGWLMRGFCPLTRIRGEDGTTPALLLSGTLQSKNCHACVRMGQYQCETWTLDRNMTNINPAWHEDHHCTSSPGNTVLCFAWQTSRILSPGLLQLMG